MKRLQTCSFCNIVNGYYKYVGVDEPIAENDDFLAIASIGAMIEGWTLILPKKHTCSMKTEYANNSLYEISNKIIPRLYSSYGRQIVFEHGANVQGSPTGCGVDHAHLHFVPFKDSLFPELISSNLNWEECRPSAIASLVGNNEYLFYAEIAHNTKWNDSVGLVCRLQQPVSKFFRKQLAKRIGDIKASDYKAYPNLYNAEQTRRTLSV